MKLYSYIIIILVLFISCTKGLDVPLPEHKPKLTLNTFLSEGSPIDLYVSRSFGLLENVALSAIAVPDAEVELWRDGQLLDVMVFVDTIITDTTGIYTENRGPNLPDTTYYFTQNYVGAKYIPSKTLPLPVAGETYAFVVRHPKYGEARGETIIPEKPDILDVRLAKDSLSFQALDYGSKMYWSALEINLQSSQPDIAYSFLTGIEYEQKDHFDTTFIFRNFDWRWPGEEILRDPDGYTYTVTRPVRNTLAEDPFSPLLWLQFPNCCYGGFEQEYNFLKLHLYALSITEDYANYSEKLRTQVDTRLSGLESVFVPSEPVVVPGNVEGGYGLVAAYNVSVIEIEL